MVVTTQDVELNSGIAAFEAKEFRRALQLLEPLSDGGNAQAQYRLAVMYQNGLGVVKRDGLAFDLMTRAAEQDLDVAQHGLGIMYLYGECVEQSAEHAVEWLEKAASDGLAGALATLAHIYATGAGGITENREKAQTLYREAGFTQAEIETLV